MMKKSVVHPGKSSLHDSYANRKVWISVVIVVLLIAVLIGAFWYSAREESVVGEAKKAPVKKVGVKKGSSSGTTSSDSTPTKVTLGMDCKKDSECGETECVSTSFCKNILTVNSKKCLLEWYVKTAGKVSNSVGELLTGCQDVNNDEKPLCLIKANSVDIIKQIKGPQGKSVKSTTTYKNVYEKDVTPPDEWVYCAIGATIDTDPTKRSGSVAEDGSGVKRAAKESADVGNTRIGGGISGSQTSCTKDSECSNNDYSCQKEILTTPEGMVYFSEDLKCILTKKDKGKSCASDAGCIKPLLCDSTKKTCLGWYDYSCIADSDCLSTFSCLNKFCGVDEKGELCKDTKDNDNDGSIDCADSGCKEFCGIPTAPTGLKVEGNSEGVYTVDLKWTAPSGANPATGYQIRAKDGDDTYNNANKLTTNDCGTDVNLYLCKNKGITGTSFTMSVIPGHTYTWWLHAANAKGESVAANGPGFTVAAKSCTADSGCTVVGEKCTGGKCVGSGQKVMKGDVNCDKMVDNLDANAILDNYFGGVDLPVCSNGQGVADVNCDKMVDNLDANAILDNYFGGVDLLVC